MKLIIISGRSGSGKSSALHTLEDEGFYCVDNLPANMLSQLPDTLRAYHQDTLQESSQESSQEGQSEPPGMAVSIDIRNVPGALEQFPGYLKDLNKRGIQCQVLYLDAGDEQLIKRYSSTRRKHPISDETTSLREAIRQEKRLLSPILAEADLRLDSSTLSVHQMRERVRLAVLGSAGNTMTVLFQSFGFKHGVPSDADFIFDVRCLPNPFWFESLRADTGLEQPVQDFMKNEPEVIDMLGDIRKFIEKWLPRFESAQRSYMTIAIGCTGGQHRSVYICKRLGEQFAGQLERVQVRHRELPE
ncbi:MAG: RNase adapter RapZ [Endozoicomonas sp.]